MQIGVFSCYYVSMKYLEPKTDEELEWNGEQFVLTRAYCKQHFDIAYRDDGTLDKRRVKNSRVVYNAIRDKLNSNNVQMGLYLINETDSGRKFIKDVLTEQMEADIQNGYNDLGVTSPINMANGQVIDRNAIRINILCPSAEMILDNSSMYFHFNIFTSFYYPWNIRAIIHGLKG